MTGVSELICKSKQLEMVHSWNLQPYISIWSKLGYCWGLFCSLLGIDAGMVSHSQSAGATLSHALLFMLFASFYLEPNIYMLHNQVFFSLLKVETLKATLFEISLTKNRLFFFSEQNSYNTVMGGSAGTREGGLTSNKVCLLHWGMSRGWSWSCCEVGNTTAVDTPINLQPQQCVCF